ncbi:ATP-dependent helicase, putative [Candida dubliniensis CD36]|uniref:Nuclear protein Sth1/Nps1 homologue, putative n=1 Tax=Candida dubliniensis (strain CD36 / ATCC MYA-646 / CBS 7987 / NCPF 3949 / NRRL Y-17841) TaxID=573826 RepID=B9WDL6_CANDC|nr:ATP-dependent helicase, putative [Candida dubliniensis CD36]CAX42772.1 ATP-dependent helicase, putative [Candida dubliniensis CD36]
MNGTAIANGNGSVGVTPASSQVQLQPDSANLITQSNGTVVPKNKDELNELLGKYYKLLFDSNKLKKEFEKSEDKSEGKFEDVNAQPKFDIESVLAQVNKEHEEYIKDETEFMQELFSDDSRKTIKTEEFDNELFEKQVAGLLLLSKDYDLPEKFQKEFTTKSDQTKKDDLVNEILEKLTELETDFETRAQSLGIKVPSPRTDKDPLHSSLGTIHAEKIISNKISQRLKELENLPANIGTFGNTDGIDKFKIQALIELKALRLLGKQKLLRHNILVHEAQQVKYVDPNLKSLPLALSEKRSFNVRPKIEQRNPQLLAVQLEELKKLEAREAKRKQHIEKVELVVEKSTSRSEAKYIRDHYRSHYLVKQINNFHQTTEKEESKKLERTAKQRLQALRSNDEEAYLKLLDKTKDHRITHLLKQTNQFLDSLTEKVRAQQEEASGSSMGTPRHGSPEVTTVDNKSDDKAELREKTDYYEVAHRIKEKIEEQPTILVGGKLKEYQMKGLEWMVSLYNNHLNGILADEMGLGKTIQSISLVTYLIEKKHENKFLIIVPLSTITNWTLEFEKWAPSVKVIVYKGSPQQRRSLQPDVRYGNFQVLLTTYEYVIRERPMLAKFHYSHMIIDEGHRMKNSQSKLSQTLRTYYKTKNRLILTGTPLQNNLPELWALLNFVLPGIFNSVKSFDDWFNTPFANTGAQEKIELTEEESLLVIRRLHKVLRPFLLRRLKKDVEKDLPDKVEKVLKCNLSGLQYVLYQQMLKHNALFVGADVGGAKSGIKGLNNKIMQLRKICNHPFVFEEVESVLNSSRLTNDLIWRVSGKFELLDRVLPKFKKSGHRVLMFFQMTQIMDIMEDFLRWRDMKYLRLDGSTKADERQDMLKVFNAPDSEYFCFLLSTRAGGLGLNLQTADTVIIFDTDWNPHQDLQAQDRAHRIGQKNEVRILRLITNDSVEEVILERAHQKLDIDGKVIQAGKFDNKSTAEEQEAFLKRLLEADANGADNEENDSLDDDELNEILARSEEEKMLFTAMDEERKSQQVPYKSRLIEKDELPSVFTEDISHHFEKKEIELSKMRDKKRVRYDDGLSEEQWLKAMDDDNDTVEEAIKRKEARIAKRKRNKAIREGLLEEDIKDDEVGEEDDEDFEVAAQPRKRQRRARTPLPHIDNDNDDIINGDNAVAELEEEEEDNDNNEPETDEFTSKCLSVIDEIMALTDETGSRNLCDVFIKFPSRKLYPDYYSIIKKPVSITNVKKLLMQDRFASFEDFIAELKQMCDNAKTYNEEGSYIHTDAIVIEKLLDEKLANHNQEV